MKMKMSPLQTEKHLISTLFYKIVYFTTKTKDNKILLCSWKTYLISVPKMAFFKQKWEHAGYHRFFFPSHILKIVKT